MAMTEAQEAVKANKVSQGLLFELAHSHFHPHSIGYRATWPSLTSVGWENALRL